jgi:hypothetical protein
MIVTVAAVCRVVSLRFSAVTTISPVAASADLLPSLATGRAGGAGEASPVWAWAGTANATARLHTAEHDAKYNDD